MAALSDEFRTIAVDLPGHGVLADVPFTLARRRRPACRGHRPRGGRPGVVVGLSLGGFVAMDLAARSPERVRGLVIAGRDRRADRSGPARDPRARLGPRHLRRAGADRRQPRGSSGPGSRRPSPTRSSPAGSSRRGGARGPAVDRRGERSCPGWPSYPGQTLILEGSLDLPLRMMERTFLRTARHGQLVRIGGRDAPLEPRPSGRLQRRRPSVRPLAGPRADGDVLRPGPEAG